MNFTSYQPQGQVRRPFSWEGILIIFLCGTTSWGYADSLHAIKTAHISHFLATHVVINAPRTGYLNIYLDQQSECKVFYKQMCWLGVYLVDLLAWWGRLQRGDLVDRITVQLATAFLVFIWHYLAEGVEVKGWSVIPSTGLIDSHFVSYVFQLRCSHRTAVRGQHDSNNYSTECGRKGHPHCYHMKQTWHNMRNIRETVHFRLKPVTLLIFLHPVFIVHVDPFTGTQNILISCAFWPNPSFTRTITDL